ncbi:hypothetical protein N0O92_12360 [Alkalihalobacillus sp. MEB130]|uniref:hypothetical protein n=1 Tax=Alkalihalobacillus sp. MEB130 TaxID=2976704 RepID=UPI0028E07534|nr:hypothetical protein [Alkalihalobacillus sp. MEB130]MDT8861027.1 hypothetical protein [Alkalihalobacillus sp. MEB130]
MTYEIKNMIIDDGFDGQEYVTADFTQDYKTYSVTFNKSDLEVINSWMFEEETSLPANLPDEVIEQIRTDVKKRI